MLWTTELAHPRKAPRNLDGDDHRSIAILPAINACFMSLSPEAKLLAELLLRSNQKWLLPQVTVARILIRNVASFHQSVFKPF